MNNIPDEELLDKIMYSQNPTVTILERGEYRAELLLRLATPVELRTIDEMTDQEFKDLVGRVKSTIKHDLDPDGSLDSQAETIAEFCRKEILARGRK